MSGEQSRGGAAAGAPTLTLHVSGSGREQADLSAALSSWARVFLSLTIYISLTIYTWLVFAMHLIFPLPHIIFLAFFYFSFLGWRHHKILATPWKHQPSHFPKLRVQEQRETPARAAAP